MRRLSLPAADDTLQALLAAYAESHRYYHTLEHLTECMMHLDAALPASHTKDEIELALWFHDAVYDPHSDKNEYDSACWAKTFIEEVSNASALAGTVFSLVMATTHGAAHACEQARWVVDVDLSILGSCEARYTRFEKSVRKEYSWVPEAEFRARRSEILQGFLLRDAIYATQHFRILLEENARRNLQFAITELSA